MHVRLFLTLASMLLLTACQLSQSTPTVVVYTSVDQVYAEPVLERFERESGVHVRAVYDVEAAKTTGLVQRLISEQPRPQADVFWNSEPAQTVTLARRGLLAPYLSLNREGIPSVYLDPDGYWSGFAGRARVLLVNVTRVPADRFPTSVFDLVDETWPGDQIAIAHPAFGTTATHGAALFAALGEQPARELFTTIRDRGVRVVDGNSVVKDQVASGQLAWGLTDTDDACAAVRAGAPVKVVVPDQDGLGTLVLTSTVAMVAGGPNPSNAARLIDFLLAPSTEAELVDIGFSEVPVRSGAPSAGCLGGAAIRPMAISFEQIVDQMSASAPLLSEIFVR
jgi:iron(III) transport system substrate-binding protein